MCRWKEKINIPTPPWMKRKRKSTIEVDSCCAVVLKHLWRHRIDTLYHCCGHSVEEPHLILVSKYTSKDIVRIRRLIRQEDNRRWKIRN